MYDLFVIGAGSGGVRASRLAAASGARVGIAEEYRIGGTCVIRGCVPKKFFVMAAEYGAHFHDAKGFGWTVDWARFDWPTLRDNVQDEVTRLSGIYRRNMDKANVQIFETRATVLGPHEVRLENTGEIIRTKRILIATGGRTSFPDLKGVEHTMTSNDAFLLEKLPTRIVIAGGGYIACEFATIFAGLGVETTLVYRGDMILRGFDEDVRRHAQTEIERAGVSVIAGANITEVAPVGEGGKLVTLSNGILLEADQVMLALGREPNTKDLGLEEVGVRLTERGAVAVDPYSRTNVESIWAVGDVTDRINLTPVAIREAVAFFETEFNNNPTSFDLAHVAAAVFTRPTVGMVGLTEKEARIRHGDVHIYKTDFRTMKNVLAANDQRMLMKLVVHPKDQRVLGVHIVGPEAAEMIQFAAIAVKAELTKAQWDATCAVHPTAAEEIVLMRERS